MRISVRNVGGYWTAQPTVEGKRRNWSFGTVAEVQKWQAQAALEARLSSRRGPSSSNPRTVQDVCAMFHEFAKQNYVRSDGLQTGEAENLRHGIQPLINLFGRMRIEEMRPRHMDAYVESQATGNVSRQTINKRLGMIKRLLLWAKNKELATPTPYEACRDYQAIRKGRNGTREAKAIRSVPLPQVEQTLTCLPKTLETMIRLQLAAAMRPEEVCAIRPVDLDMRQTPWLYVPPWHKNEHRGVQRRIYLGPTARALLTPFLVPGNTFACIFSPRVAVRERRGKMPKARHVGDAYTTRSYRKAIWYACDEAFPLPVVWKRRRVESQGRKRWRLETVAEWTARLGAEAMGKARTWRRDHRWSPNRLRKAGLSAVERTHGKQAAKSIAGHSRVETTQDFYLERDDVLARSVAEKAG